jgi:short-subunit dehydrogenase
MRADDGEGHVVISASWLGLVARRRLGTYVATQHALVGIAETLREELAGSRIGVSVLCPRGVRSGFAANSARLGRSVGVRVDLNPELERRLRDGIEPRTVGDCVLDGIRNERFWLLPHTGDRGEVEARYEGILSALEESAELGWQDDFGASAQD